MHRREGDEPAEPGPVVPEARVRNDAAPPLRRALRAGVAYFALVFAVGFALGTVRTLLVAPGTGEILAVLLEMPLILGASWWIAGGLVRRVAVPPALSARLLMGGTALVLLLVAEAGLGILAFGRSPEEHLAHYGTAPGALGLAGQVVFGLFPALHRDR